MKLTRKCLAVFIATILCISTMQMPAFADEEPVPTENVEETISEETANEETVNEKSEQEDFSTQGTEEVIPEKVAGEDENSQEQENVPESSEEAAEEMNELDGESALTEENSIAEGIVEEVPESSAIEESTEELDEEAEESSFIEESKESTEQIPEESEEISEPSGEESEESKNIEGLNHSSEDPSEKSIETNPEDEMAAGGTSGTCGNNLTWTLSDDGVLTISGTGDMWGYNYYISGNPSPFWLNGEISSVIIESGVTSIGNEIFLDCSQLKSVEIPDSVQSIGERAFYGCSSLNSIEIPSSVRSIGEWAFSGCSSLNFIEIPNSVRSIGERAFSGCSSLNSIEIPNSVTSIEDETFMDCLNLTSIVISDGVMSIGKQAFYSCRNLTSIVIPKTVNFIGQSCFYDCGALKEIVVDPDNSCYSSEDGVLFTEDRQIIIRYPSAKEEISYPIPDEVTSIGNGAFSGCSNLTSIIIPDGVTSIGGGAFSRCSNLTSIIIPDGVTNIGNSAFYECMKLTSIAIPNGVTSIGNYTFYECRSLTSFVIPNGVTSIGDSAFYECTSLTSVVIPATVSYIGRSAFTAWRMIIHYLGTEEEWNNISRESNILENTQKYYVERLYTWDEVDSGFQVTAVAQDASGFNETETVSAVLVDDTESTCNTDGRKIYSASFINPIFEAQQKEVIIPAAGHDYKLTAWEWNPEMDGALVLTYSCSRCGDTYQAVDFYEVEYSYSWIEYKDGYKVTGILSCEAAEYNVEETVIAELTDVQEQTCEKDGVKRYKAEFKQLLPDTKEDVFPATGHQYAPETVSVGRVSLQRNRVCFVCGKTDTTTLTGTMAGECGQEAVYLVSGSILYILGNGPLYNYSTAASLPWYSAMNSITSVVIGAGITDIKDIPLMTFCNARTISVEAESESYTVIDGVCFSKDLKTLVYYPGGQNRSTYTIPEGTQTIGAYAFYRANLKTVSIPGTVTAIGSSAFGACGALSSITIPDSVSSIGSAAFTGCGALTSIIIPEAVQRIDEGTFLGCLNLKSITLPEKISYVGPHAFRMCTALKDIYYQSTRDNWNVTVSNDNSYFSNATLHTLGIAKGQCGDDMYWVISDEGELSLTGTGKMYDYALERVPIDVPWYSYRDQIKSLRIGGEIEKLTPTVFVSFNNVTTVNVDYTSRTYSSRSGGILFNYDGTEFVYYPNANSTRDNVILSDYIQSIGAYAFCNNLFLNNIYVPNNIQEIPEGAFYMAVSLESIQVPDNVNKIGSNAFCWCSTLRSAELPESVVSIGDKAFQNCSKLSRITYLGYYKQWQAVQKGDDIYNADKVTVYYKQCENHDIQKVEGYPATCTSDGMTDGQICNICGETIVEQTVIKGGHTPVSIAAVAPTCSETGLTEGAKCSVCGKILNKQETIPAKGHILVIDPAVEATLTTTGLTQGKHCSVCGEVLVEQKIVPVKKLTIAGLSAASSGKNKVTLTWTVEPKAEGYLIYAQRNGVYGYVGMVGSGSRNTFTDTKALADDYNFYWVFPYVKDQTGKMFAGTCSKYVFAKGVCAPVTEKKAASIKGGVKLTWTGSKDAEGYLIYGIVDGKPYGYIGMTTKGTTYTDKKASNTQYNFYWIFPYFKDASGKMITGAPGNYVYGRALK